MNDLEMTKLCAEAMGYKVGTFDEMGADGEGESETALVAGVDDLSTALAIGGLYDPLHNDAQAMALVKALRLTIDPAKSGGFVVSHAKSGNLCESSDLNRAIVECAAKMQGAKHE